MLVRVAVFIEREFPMRRVRSNNVKAHRMGVELSRTSSAKGTIAFTRYTRSSILNTRVLLPTPLFYVSAKSQVYTLDVDHFIRRKKRITIGVMGRIGGERNRRRTFLIFKERRTLQVIPGKVAAARNMSFFVAFAVGSARRSVASFWRCTLSFRPTRRAWRSSRPYRLTFLA